MSCEFSFAQVPLPQPINAMRPCNTMFDTASSYRGPDSTGTQRQIGCNFDLYPDPAGVVASGPSGGLVAGLHPPCPSHTVAAPEERFHQDWTLSRFTSPRHQPRRIWAEAGSPQLPLFTGCVTPTLASWPARTRRSMLFSNSSGIRTSRRRTSISAKLPRGRLSRQCNQGSGGSNARGSRNSPVAVFLLLISDSSIVERATPVDWNRRSAFY